MEAIFQLASLCHKTQTKTRNEKETKWSLAGSCKARGRGGQETRRSATNEVWMTCTGCRLIAVKFMGHRHTAKGREGQTAACLRFNEFARAHANCSVAITLSGNINQNVLVVILLAPAACKYATLFYEHTQITLIFRCWISFAALIKL